MKTKLTAEERYQAACKRWIKEDEELRKMVLFNQIYCTSYCNQGHRMGDGKPVNHECYIIPPAALEAEREGDYEKAIELMKGPRTPHRGLRIP